MLEDYVKRKVESGLYNNASEVIREALRLKIAAEATDEAKLQRLRDAIEPAWQEAERAEFTDYSLEKSLAKLSGRGSVLQSRRMRMSTKSVPIPRTCGAPTRPQAT